MNLVDTLKTLISALKQGAVRDDPNTSPGPCFSNRDDLVDVRM
jgi:hypothetical protein